jgi:hypothetical protein
MLTNLSTIKQRLGLQDADVKDDAILTNALAAVSARFEQECNRQFGLVLGQKDEFQGDETELRVRSYPVVPGSVSLFEVKSNETDGFVAQDPAQFEFVVRKNFIISLVERLGTWKMVLRVTYSGGYILPDGTSPAPPAGSNPPALPDDLEQAAVEQVCYWYQSRNRLGLVSVSGEGGSISQYAQLDLLPSVKAVLKRHERWLQ